MSVSRLVDAPRELVWKIWTEPEHVKEWWGPNGFTNSIHKFNPVPGGEWIFTMHGPDGTDYPNSVRFVEVIRNERLIYDHAQPEDGGSFRTFVHFTDEGGKTRLSMRAVFSTIEYRQLLMEKYGALEGQQQHIARMVEYADKLRSRGI
ncbi:MAG: SRPBCC family protein [Spirochaetota bacterium]